MCCYRRALKFERVFIVQLEFIAIVECIFYWSNEAKVKSRCTRRTPRDALPIFILRCALHFAVHMHARICFYCRPLELQLQLL
jgi:hypothetical protein